MFSSTAGTKSGEGFDNVLDNENKIFLIFTNPITAAQDRMTMKRYEARRYKVNALLEFYIEKICSTNV